MLRKACHDFVASSRDHEERCKHACQKKEMNLFMKSLNEYVDNIQADREKEQTVHTEHRLVVSCLYKDFTFLEANFVLDKVTNVISSTGGVVSVQDKHEFFEIIVKDSKNLNLQRAAESVKQMYPSVICVIDGSVYPFKRTSITYGRSHVVDTRIRNVVLEFSKGFEEYDFAGSRDHLARRRDAHNKKEMNIFLKSFNSYVEELQVEYNASRELILTGNGKYSTFLAAGFILDQCMTATVVDFREDDDNNCQLSIEVTNARNLKCLKRTLRHDHPHVSYVVVDPRHPVDSIIVSNLKECGGAVQSDIESHPISADYSKSIEWPVYHLTLEFPRGYFGVAGKSFGLEYLNQMKAVTSNIVDVHDDYDCHKISVQDPDFNKLEMLALRVKYDHPCIISLVDIGGEQSKIMETELSLRRRDISSERIDPLESKETYPLVISEILQDLDDYESRETSRRLVPIPVDRHESPEMWTDISLNSCETASAGFDLFSWFNVANT